LTAAKQSHNNGEKKDQEVKIKMTVIWRCRKSEDSLVCPHLVCLSLPLLLMQLLPIKFIFHPQPQPATPATAGKGQPTPHDSATTTNATGTSSTSAPSAPLLCPHPVASSPALPWPSLRCVWWVIMVIFSPIRFWGGHMSHMLQTYVNGTKWTVMKMDAMTGGQCTRRDILALDSYHAIDTHQCTYDCKLCRDELSSNYFAWCHVKFYGLFSLLISLFLFSVGLPCCLALFALSIGWCADGGEISMRCAVGHLPWRYRNESGELSKGQNSCTTCIH
jgi:hypothetical protein